MSKTNERDLNNFETKLGEFSDDSYEKDNNSDFFEDDNWERYSDYSNEESNINTNNSNHHNQPLKKENSGINRRKRDSEYEHSSQRHSNSNSNYSSTWTEDKRGYNTNRSGQYEKYDKYDKFNNYNYSKQNTYSGYEQYDKYEKFPKHKVNDNYETYDNYNNFESYDNQTSNNKKYFDNYNTEGSHKGYQNNYNYKYNENPYDNNSGNYFYKNQQYSERKFSKYNQKYGTPTNTNDTNYQENSESTVIASPNKSYMYKDQKRGYKKYESNFNKKVDYHQKIRNNININISNHSNTISNNTLTTNPVNDIKDDGLNTPNNDLVYNNNQNYSKKNARFEGNKERNYGDKGRSFGKTNESNKYPNQYYKKNENNKRDNNDSPYKEKKGINPSFDDLKKPVFINSKLQKESENKVESKSEVKTEIKIDNKGETKNEKENETKKGIPISNLLNVPRNEINGKIHSTKEQCLQQQITNVNHSNNQGVNINNKTEEVKSEVETNHTEKTNRVNNSHTEITKQNSIIVTLPQQVNQEKKQEQDSNLLTITIDPNSNTQIPGLNQNIPIQHPIYQNNINFNPLQRGIDQQNYFQNNLNTSQFPPNQIPNYNYQQMNQIPNYNYPLKFNMMNMGVPNQIIPQSFQVVPPQNMQGNPMTMQMIPQNFQPIHHQNVVSMHNNQLTNYYSNQSPSNNLMYPQFVQSYPNQTGNSLNTNFINPNNLQKNQSEEFNVKEFSDKLNLNAKAFVPIKKKPPENKFDMDLYQNNAFNDPKQYQYNPNNNSATYYYPNMPK